MKDAKSVYVVNQEKGVVIQLRDEKLIERLEMALKVIEIIQEEGFQDVEFEDKDFSEIRDWNFFVLKRKLNILGFNLPLPGKTLLKIGCGYAINQAQEIVSLEKNYKCLEFKSPALRSIGLIFKKDFELNGDSDFAKYQKQIPLLHLFAQTK